MGSILRFQNYKCYNVCKIDPNSSQECTDLWKDMGQLLDVATFSDVALVIYNLRPSSNYVT